MREIKFRAWDSDENTMWYMPELESDESPNELLSNFLDDYYDCVLLKFTGLKDKNGKEIYEGDIISKNGRGRHEVYYGGAMFYAKHDTDSYSLTHIRNEKLEVIGNIYEIGEKNND